MRLPAQQEIQDSRCCLQGPRGSDTVTVAAAKEARSSVGCTGRGEDQPDTGPLAPGLD